MSALKLFFPSWKFFDQLGTVSNLYYRVQNKDGFSQWHLVLMKPKRRIWNLFFNPDGNYYLAALSLVERLVQKVSDSDAEKLKQIERWPEYQRLERLVSAEIKTKLRSGQKYQFKIQVHQEKQSEAEDFIISKELCL